MVRLQICNLSFSRCAVARAGSKNHNYSSAKNFDFAQKKIKRFIDFPISESGERGFVILAANLRFKEFFNLGLVVKTNMVKNGVKIQME